MSDNTGIEWADATWNPVTGCTKVSDGCKHCYVERDWGRLANNPKTPHYNGRKFTDVRTRSETLDQPLRWIRPRKVFVNSMSDLFHPSVPFAFIDQVFAVMGLARHHTFQVLTKRPERMLEYLTAENRTRDISMVMVSKFGHDGTYAGPWPFPNVLLGVTVENQEAADERIPLLLQSPAAARFLSCEPLLGLVNLGPYTLTERPCFVCKAEDSTGADRGSMSHPINCGWRHDQEMDGMQLHNEPDGRGIDWVIVGGESGPKARPMHPEWVRSLRNQCATAGTPFLFKQWGEWLPGEQTADSGTAYRRCDNGEIYAVAGNPRRENFGTHPDRNSGPLIALRIGKKAAGRILDGLEHLEYPEVRR